MVADRRRGRRDDSNPSGPATIRSSELASQPDPSAPGGDTTAGPEPAAPPPPRIVTGRDGRAVIERLACGTVFVPLVRCSGRIDDDVFFAVYDAVTARRPGDPLYLVVDLRAADMSVGYDGYARAARMVRRRGIGTVMAVICDSDPARLLDAKAGQEMAAVNGLRIVQRVIGRIEDAAAAMAAMMARDPA